MSDTPLIVWILYREVSDQMGTDKIFGIYSTEAKAKSVEESITDSRTFIKRFVVDWNLEDHAK